jgi:hypothetical protein
MVLGVGIDWAEAFHLVALGRPGEGVIQLRRVEHTPAAVAGLLAHIATLEPDPTEVRVVLETRHGTLVERLVDAGFTVLPVNPDLVARRRGPARKKDDAEDARICCVLALDRYTSLRPLLGHGELAAELRAIARDDERAARDQRRLLNRLRADLLATFPAALQVAGDDLGAPTILKLLERWPTHQALATASWEELGDFARAAHHGWPERFADQVAQALAADHFTPGTTWSGPRPTPSAWPLSSCWRSGPSVAPGSAGWAHCCWAPPGQDGPTPPDQRSSTRGRRSLAARST